MTDHDDKSLVAARKALKKSRRTANADTADNSKSENQNATNGENGASNSEHSRPSSPFKASGFRKILSVADVFWNGWTRPITRFLNPVTQRIWAFYGWSYQKFAHKNTEDGTRSFSRNRAAIVTMLLGLITVTTPFALISHVIPTLSRTVYDAGMLVTMKEDHLFLGRAELINPERELFQVMGCRDIKGCDGGDNTTYYRLRNNVILDIKYWTTRFEPYDPAEIAGAMVSELNDCKIKYYGRRSKALGWYPYIVSASCKPV